jgi:SAM-dependent methyltransferase
MNASTRENVHVLLRRVGIQTRFPWPVVPPGRTALNLGAGYERIRGYESHDLAPVGVPPPDHVFDMERTPWPLPDAAYDVVVLRNVLEHCSDTIAVMSEVWRIAKPGARVVVSVPHWHGDAAYLDPTHRRSFAYGTFDFFDERTALGKGQGQYYSRARFRIDDCWTRPLRSSCLVSGRAPNAFLRWLAPRVGGVVQGMVFFLTVAKAPTVSAKEADSREA